MLYMAGGRQPQNKLMRLRTLKKNALHGCPRTTHADHPNGMLRKRIGSSKRCKLWVQSPEETAEFSSRSMEWRRRCMPG